jgi:hypothetical protein
MLEISVVLFDAFLFGLFLLCMPVVVYFLYVWFTQAVNDLMNDEK